MGYAGPETSYQFSIAARADMLRVVKRHGINNGGSDLELQGESSFPGEDVVYRLGSSEQPFNVGGLGLGNVLTYYISEERTRTVDRELVDTSNGEITAEQISASGLLRASIEWRYDIERFDSGNLVRRSVDAKLQNIHPGKPTGILMLMQTVDRPCQERIPPEQNTAESPSWNQWVAFADRAWEKQQARKRDQRNQEFLSHTQEQLDIRHLMAAIQAFGGSAKHLQKRRDKDDRAKKQYQPGET
jgi:hypothetical protein